MPRSFFAAMTLFLAALYPVVIYFGFRYDELRLAGLYLLIVALLRFAVTADRSIAVLAGTLFAALFSVVIALTQDEALARFYPVTVNLMLLIAFGVTIFRPPAMVTRIAQASGTVLDARGVSYTRRVTAVWCAFFALNSCIALYTVVGTSREVWVIYNGFISYVAAGALLVGEWLVRPTAATVNRA